MQPHVVHRSDGCVAVALQYHAPPKSYGNGIFIYMGQKELESFEVSCVLNSIFSAVGIPLSASESQWRRGMKLGERSYLFNDDAMTQIVESITRFGRNGERLAPRFLSE
ncbi:MAG: hypothetical protein IPK81_17370 [Rhodospirillales bacterium]|nr:MAG: hypothetical protein IPK81_17370 [Rhodospirillales bacterium]